MASSLVNLKALGLNFSPNNIDLPEGSLLSANNVVIRRDNTVSPRRGLKDYSTPFNNEIKQLLQYRGRVLSHVGDGLFYDTTILDAQGRSNFSKFAGIYNEPADGTRIKYIGANKNIYFTTSDGIKKISAVNAQDFNSTTDFIQNAGAVKAIDFTTTLNVVQGQTTGFLPSDGAVAYRVVWGYKDRTDNLLFGSPSERAVVYNFLQDLIPDDLNTLLLALDNLDQTGSLINNGDYFSTNSVELTTTATNLQSAVIDIATKIDENIQYAIGAVTVGIPLEITDAQVIANTATLVFATDPTPYLKVNDKIRCYNFNTTSPLLTFFNNADITPFFTITAVNDGAVPLIPNSIQFVIPEAQNFVLGAVAINVEAAIEGYNYRFITSTGDATFVRPLSTDVITAFPTSEQLRIIQNTIDRIHTQLLIELNGVVPDTLKTQYLASYSITEIANVTLNINIPSGVLKSDDTTDYFVQVYRSRNFVATQIQSLGPGGFVPIEPDDELRLIYEAFPTENEILNRSVIFFDTYPEELAVTNANLYTNPVTGEGILQANEIPPFAKDINRFKRVTFYSNTRTKQRLNPFQLIGTSGLITSTQKKITIGTEGSRAITYQFVQGVQQVVELQFDAVNPTNLKTAFEGKFFNINTPTRVFYIWFRYDGITAIPVFPTTSGILIQVDVLTTDSIAQVTQKFVNSINAVSYDFNAVLVGTGPSIITFTCVDQGIAVAPALNGDPGNDIDIVPLTTYSLLVTTVGDGEDALAFPPKVLLVDDITSLTPITRAQAIDETARSLVRVINKQPTSLVYAYYISGENISPGIVNLEAKLLSTNEVYVVGSDSEVGISFNPEISPVTIVSGAGVITGSGNIFTVIQPPTDKLINGDKIIISASNSDQPIDGVFTVSNANNLTFNIVSTFSSYISDGTYIAYSKLSDAVVSNNELRVNRVYYSKPDQPEAVPLLNYFDLGSSTEENLRIFPLRDSLFTFKEDGLYRVSGEGAPFVTGLFDTSCVLIAPDSVAVSNNIIYAWTVKGISNVTESGVVEISRPIDIEFFKLSSASFTNFKRVTWGIGYDGDNSYTVFTNSDNKDTYPTIGFRFDNQTNTWTSVVRPQTCGIIFRDNDKLYMGNGETRVIDEERKDFTRTDYADRDFPLLLQASNSVQNNGKKLVFPSVLQLEEGDVVVQEQLVTIDIFNDLLLKLDEDTGINDDTFFSNLKASAGTNIRSSILALAVQLNENPDKTVNYETDIGTISDDILSIAVGTTDTKFITNTPLNLIPGRVITFSVLNQAALSTLNVDLNGLIATVVSYDITSRELVIELPSSVTQGSNILSLALGDLTFSTGPNELNTQDIKTCYNSIIESLNSDNGVTFSNYLPFLGEVSIIEAVIDSVNITNRFVLLNLALPWVLGNVVIYKAIPVSFRYSPITFGNTLALKQVYQGTVMFNSTAFTRASIGYATDLKPEFIFTKITGIGNGIFGHYSNPGFGYGFFGGGGNSAPFRTTIPLQAQRCRLMNVEFRHKIARESIDIYGISLTGNLEQSERAYR